MREFFFSVIIADKHQAIQIIFKNKVISEQDFWIGQEKTPPLMKKNGKKMSFWPRMVSVFSDQDIFIGRDPPPPLTRKKTDFFMRPLSRTNPSSLVYTLANEGPNQSSTKMIMTISFKLYILNYQIILRHTVRYLNQTGKIQVASRQFYGGFDMFQQE